MSGAFTAAWLERRTAADARARSPVLQARLLAWCAGRDRLAVADLGAGTGANLRHLAPALAVPQAWLLVERDQDLIAAGRTVLAEAVAGWRYLDLDLAADLERLEALRPELITAASLLDLVGSAWLQRLTDLRARLGAALYLVLTVDGRIAWSPGDPDDAACMALVARHQRRDKGFGPALGGEAVAVLQRLLAPVAGELLLGRSDWRLGVDDAALQRELLAGYVEAAKAVDPGRGAWVAAWGERRERLIRSPDSGLSVGHLDLLFLPHRP